MRKILFNFTMIVLLSFVFFETQSIYGQTCDNPYPYGEINLDLQSGDIESGEAVWYSFTTNEDFANVVISLCGSDFDTKLSLWQAEDCSDPDATSSNNSSFFNDDDYSVSIGNCSPASKISLATYFGNEPYILPAGSYAVKVFGNLDNYGHYQLSITARELSLENDFTLFTFEDQTVSSTINEEEHTVNIQAAFATDLNGLIATFETSDYVSSIKIGEVEQTSGETSNNFTGDVIYTIASEDASLQEWTVSTTVAEYQSPENDFLAFGFPNSIGEAIIDNVNHTINAVVSFNADLGNLNANYTLSPLSSTNDNFTDFNSEVIYTVIAEDQTEQLWTVNVTLDNITVTSFPWNENFESSTFYGWTQVENDDWDWQLGIATSTNGTGPQNGDNTSGDGNFAFTEASGNSNSTMEIITRPFQLNLLDDPALKFFYYMYGNNIGTLSVDILYNEVWTEGIFTFSGEQGMKWKSVCIDLSDYNGLVQIKFKGVVGNGARSDIAIDDITVFSNDALPACVENILPENNATEIERSGTLEFSSENATSYKLSLSKDVNFQNNMIVNGEDLGNTTTYNYENLEWETVYYWRIIANNLNGDAVNCQTYSFTTETAPEEGISCSNPFSYGNINDISINGIISSENDELWYSVTLDDNYLDVEFALCGSNFDTQLEIWQDCNNYLYYADDGCVYEGQNTTSSLLKRDYLDAGTYFIKIYSIAAALDGNYTLSVTGRTIATENDILSFTFDEAVNTVFEGNNINIDLLSGSNITSLNAIYTISEYSQITGNYTDFTNTVQYTVTAEDGTPQVWNVTVNVLEDAPPIEIKIGEITACPGEEVIIPVNMKYGTNLGAISIYVEYDPSTLTFIEYENLNDEILNGNYVIDDDNGVIGLNWFVNFTLPLTPANIEDGKIFDLKFTYLGGDAILNIENQENEITDISAVTPQDLNIFNGGVFQNLTPEINTQPENKSVCENSTTAFGVNATNVLIYKWQVNNGVDGWTDIENSNSGFLSVDANISNDGNLYRCVMANECEITSDEVTLNVLQTPEAIISANDIAGLCPESEVEIQIDFTNGTLPFVVTYSDGSNETTTTLADVNPYIFNVTTEGEYTLVSVTDYNSCETNTSGSVNVEYVEKPTATFDSESYGICNDEPATVLVNFTGNAPYSINYIGPSGSVNVTDINENYYEIISIQNSNYYLISVSDVNCLGEIGEFQQANVNQVNPPLAIFGSDLEITEGETAEITVNLTQGTMPYDLTYNDGINEFTVTDINENPYTLSVSPTETTTYNFISVDDVNCSNNLTNENVNVNVTPLNDLTGKITYNNDNNIGLENVTVSLAGFVNSTLVSFTTTTDANGDYLFAVPNGNYTITAAKNEIDENDKNSANSTDAMMAAQRGINIINFTDFQENVGDVSNNGNVNATDALLIVRRFVDDIQEFPVGNWYFESKEILVNNGDITVDFKGACYGDINFSNANYSGSKKLEMKVSLINDGIINIESSNFNIPIKVANEMKIGALTLTIDFPSDIVKIKNVTSKFDNLLYKVVDNKIKIAAYDVNTLFFNENENLINFELERISDGDIYFEMENNSEIADENKALKNVILNTPNIENIENFKFDFSLSNYPNPLNSETTIKYNVLENAKVQLTVYDITGRKIKEIVNENQEKGVYLKEFDATLLSNGVYLYEIKIKSENYEYYKVNKMTINK